MANEDKEKDEGEKQGIIETKKSLPYFKSGVLLTCEAEVLNKTVLLPFCQLCKSFL